MIDGGPSRNNARLAERQSAYRSEMVRRQAEFGASVKQPSPVGEIDRRPEPILPRSKPRKNLTIIILSVALVIMVLLVGYLALRPVSGGLGSSIDNSKYQAVFFANGQVYFGKLKIENGDYLKLSDVFYIQSDTAAIESDSESISSETVAEQKLIKRGAEVYGPEDPMVIDRNQVMFFENLKTDSEVAQLIRNYKSSSRQ